MCSAGQVFEIMIPSSRSSLRLLAHTFCALSLIAVLGCGAGSTEDPPGGSGGSGGGGSSRAGGGSSSSSSESGPGPRGCPDCKPGRLTGVNWFGFETTNYFPHGLWARDYKSMLKQIKDLGFNSVRLPWCNDMLKATPTGIQVNAYGTDPYTKEPLNLDLGGLTSLQVMDKILDECNRIGLKVILDNHSRAHDGYMQETLWYTKGYDEETWISDWVMLIERYKDNPAVVAADLKNEPHGNTTNGMKPPATWGYDQDGYGTTDWRKAAVKCGQAILKANPKITIIVEGVENYRGDNYWWGGNLKGVEDFPIKDSEIPSSNLWYSSHEYGPEVYNQTWFQASSFPDNLPDIWDSKFWFIHKKGIAPLFFGEFGIKEASAADHSSTAYKWLTTFMEYAGKDSSWTFWCMNPNSGDTEGILKDDWVSVNKAKYELIKPYLATD
jgi:aryl-phospho-beta-D-glucosidase BglC (GH1 family)